MKYYRWLWPLFLMLAFNCCRPTEASSVCRTSNALVDCISSTVPSGTVTSAFSLTSAATGAAPVLTVSAPAASTVTSGAALPTLVFGVTRQAQSAAPTNGLQCATQGTNALNYACVASGDIIQQTAASCVCNAAAIYAPTVSSNLTYTIAVTASADTLTTPGTASTSITVVPGSASGPGRGCTDDVTVPVIREIDFATTPSFPKELYPFTTYGDGISSPPSVASIRLRVVEGGGLWQDGSMQIGPGLGTSTAEAVISRCRGRFDAGGRVQIIRLEGYNGPGQQSATTFFPLWWVDPNTQPDAYTARLNAPGRVAPDGWVSDGIYYVNMRQTWCSAGYGGTCHREVSGTGAVVPH